MSIKVLVPNLPESVADATLITWHKKSGEPVRREENLVDLETDKVVLEVPAPGDGILGEVMKNDGDTVSSGETLAVIDEQDTQNTSTVVQLVETESPQQSPPLTPSVRRALAEHELDAESIPGTGKDGRITKADIEHYLENRAPAAPSTPPEPTPEARPAEPTMAPPTLGERPEQRVPMTRLRARIAERLVEAQQSAAILTTFNEVDLQAIMEVRRRYKEAFEKEHSTKLGFMSFFVKSSIDALKRFPVINASVDGQDIVYHGYFDIAIAVSSPRGLVVPIMRDADRLSFAEIENKIADFSTRAQSGDLSYEELTGGTFTISNGGIFGSMLSTPILNPPQSAILGMHAIQQRPVVRNGEIVIRPMMYLALSYDHRIIDGREAVQFLVQVKQRLEDPMHLLLEL